MENPDHPTEGDPLKREDGVEEGIPPPTSDVKKTCKDLGFAKLTHWRTAVFFFSLFLCLTIVFAFSFIIPCPVRPQYLISWNRTFNETGTYDFLAVEYANDDKVMDVLFVIKSIEGSQNNTCAEEGLSSPCIFMVSVDGTDGETLWEQPLEPEFHWAQCGLGNEGSNWDCLVSHSDKLTAVDKNKGTIQWQQPQPAGEPNTAPVLSVPDLNEDKVGDVALVVHNSDKTEMTFLSGKTGTQIGSTVALVERKNNVHLLYRTKDGSYYIIFEKDIGLFGIALWRVADKAKAGNSASLTKDKQWESNANETTGHVQIFKADKIRHVLKTTKKEPNLLIVTGAEVVKVDGNMKILWIYNTSSVLGPPSFGNFNENKGDVLDVVIEEAIGNNKKKVIILDGESGVVIWEVTLQDSPNSPQPASIRTNNFFSVFMFWGLVLTDNNSSIDLQLTSNRRVYMLHPLHSKVLLESTNIVDHIITFRATLLEHGRHAAYFILTGPSADGAAGFVTLTKRKLKQDVPDSKVVRIGTGGDTETNELIKQAFNRLRFSD